MRGTMMRMACVTWLVLAATGAWAQGTPAAGGAPAADVSGAGEGDDLPLLLHGMRQDDASRTAAPPIAGAVDGATYRLGPGDVLRLQLWGRLSRIWTLEVGPEGTIVIPGSGPLQVTNRVLAGVRAEVLAKLGVQFRGVSMDLRLARPRQFLIYLTGQVKTAGPVSASGADRLADAVRGGSLQGNASLRRIQIAHADGTSESADLGLFLATGDARLNPWLRDGDVIQVPVATDFIYAQGALALPGRFELGPGDSLLTLFHLTGGPIPAADRSRALLLHWRDPFTPESLWIQLDRVYARVTNPPLRDGDRLYVYYLPQYHLQHEAYVAGEVARPGAFPVTEGRHRLSDLVAAAGAFLPTADLSAIRVHRRGTEGREKDPELDRLLRLSREQLTASEFEALQTKLAGLREDYRVDWNRLRESPQDLDLLIRDGDIVTVIRLVNSVRVDGEVRRPGILTYRPGQSIADYVHQAGGLTSRAWRSRIRVTRAVTGQTLPARNVPVLDPGDFVWVPEQPDKTVWDHTRGILTALAQIATVIIGIRSVR